MNAIRLEAERLVASPAARRLEIGLALWSLGLCLTIAGGLTRAKRAGRDEERRAEANAGLKPRVDGWYGIERSIMDEAMRLYNKKLEPPKVKMKLPPMLCWTDEYKDYTHVPYPKIYKDLVA